MVRSPTPGGQRHLWVAASARGLKRELGPTAWAVLEDIALDADVDEGRRLVATTSSRRIAENLGLTPGTAARALGRLRSLGLVSHTRLDGTAGRFGLSAYVLGPLPGLDVRCGDDRDNDRRPEPRVDRPGAARPRPAEPCVGDRHMAVTTGGPARRRPPARPLPSDGQLDLLSAVDAGSPPAGPMQDRADGADR